MKIIEYILEVIICSGLFLVLYRWLLAGKVSYRICRIYIIGTMLLAAVIPALDVPLYPPAPPSVVSVPADISDGTMPDNKSVLYSPGESTAASITDSTAATETVKTGADIRTVVLNIITAVYCLAAAASIALIVLNMIKIRRLRRSARLTRWRTGLWPRAGRYRLPSRSCGQSTWASTTPRPSG
ncbi:MAG TPA: hypothetical protein IAC03_07890 [Candidatus Coprenecus pullistercoris]|nr:hypothetical protein [Candidatus Coprenecus pullistercoris]